MKWDSQQEHSGFKIFYSILSQVSNFFLEFARKGGTVISSENLHVLFLKFLHF